MKLNQNFEKLQESYLFLNIAQKVSAYQQAHPAGHIIRMGIGDVTRPLAPAVIEAMHKATDEMAHQETFQGYPPAEGQIFLREKIQSYYADRSVTLALSEIIIGDGAKSDVGNIVDLFDADNEVLIPDPVYPVYVDTNLMSGRPIRYLPATEQDGFLPLPDGDTKGDIIYLCSPNNPTGAVYDRQGLQAWVNFALEQGAVILFDAAYESFISEEKLPRSIFEIPGADRCAIEFCSFSKTAGFTGMRCGYTVISNRLQIGGVRVNQLWARRQSTKFNGVSYITQRAAEAVFTVEGRRQINETINYYRDNAKLMADSFRDMGIRFTGGENSPYIWHRCPDGMSSWDYFDYLLENAEVVGTPGSGFGQNGEGYFRLTAFGSKEKTAEAMERIRKLLQ